MNIYDVFVARTMFAPNLLADIAVEWDEAMTPRAKAWVHRDRTEALDGVKATMLALDRGDLSDLPDEAICVLWNVEEKVTQRRRGKRPPVKLSVRQREMIVTEVIIRAIRWKCGA